MIREELRTGGFADAQVQNFGTARDVLVRYSPRAGGADLADQGGKLGQQILASCSSRIEQVDLRRIEFVGPQVGKDLIQGGILAVLACAGH